jgi:hypothetical protein
VFVGLAQTTAEGRCGRLEDVTPDLAGEAAEVTAFWQGLGLPGLDALAKLEIGDDWLRAVCYENPARLFGL